MTEKVARSKQPDSSQLYECEDCPGKKFVLEDMFVHSSGSVTNFCKESMSKRRKAGRARMKLKRSRQKAAVVASITTTPRRKSKSDDLSPKMRAVFSIFETKKVGFIFSLARLQETYGKGSKDGLRHTIQDLINRKMVVRVGRGRYKRRLSFMSASDVPAIDISHMHKDSKLKQLQSDNDINMALQKANDDTSVFKRFAEVVINKFKEAGKKLLKIEVIVDDDKIVIRYEALETGEVVL